VPWQQWPFWKQLLLVIVLAAVVWALYRVGRELFFAAAAILAAFAELLGVVVRTLPHVMLAGIIALGGVWVINHLDNSLVRMPTWLQASDQTTAPEAHPASPSAPQSSTSQPNTSPQEQK
jgi:thiol:disulfide interchange protein